VVIVASEKVLIDGSRADSAELPNDLRLAQHVNNPGNTLIRFNPCFDILE
jgi:hypothetical protein